MNISERIKALFNRLLFLGYQSFQIEQIIKEALGQCTWEKDDHKQNLQILINLEKYERLGNAYLLTYSK